MVPTSHMMILILHLMVPNMYNDLKKDKKKEM